MNEDIINVEPTNKLLYEITQALKDDGVYCLENAINKEFLTDLQNEVRVLVGLQGSRYFSLINPYKDSKSKFSIFKNSKRLYTLLHELAKLGFDRIFDNSEILNVLRVVTGENTGDQALKFHYDATVITIFVPIIVPRGTIKDSGHLLAFRNLRQIRSYAILNILEKVLLQNSIIQKVFSNIATNKTEKYLYELREGNIYIFYGYRTLHENFPVNPNYLRATLLFHYGNPHDSSWLIKSIAKFRHWREMINLNN
jgi:hypothetical protein